MDKSIFKSKTIWGFGLLGITLLGRILGIIPDVDATRIIEILTGFLGIYGLRDAIGNNNVQ